MNKKVLPAIYSSAFWSLFVVLPFFLALLRNRCYSFHRTKCDFEIGSFENEALENEDRSTKHTNLENEAPKSRNEAP